MVVTGGRSSGPPRPGQPANSPLSPARTPAGFVSPARRGRQRVPAALHPDNAHTTLCFSMCIRAHLCARLRKEPFPARYAPALLCSVVNHRSVQSRRIERHSQSRCAIRRFDKKEENASDAFRMTSRHSRRPAARRRTHRMYPFPRRDTPAFWTCPARDVTERWRALRS